MKDRISLTLEGVGTGLFWILGGFTLLIFTAPFFWFGEALSDLRWHMGFLALLPAVPGALFLPRRRLTFIGLAAMGMLNVMPGLRVFVPPSEEVFTAGEEITLLEAHWGHEPTAALEELLVAQPADLVFVTGLDMIGRASLKERLAEYAYSEVWPPLLVDTKGEVTPLEEDTTMLFSKLPLEDFTVTGFDSGACLIEATLAIGDLPVSLRAAVLPPPGPGSIGASRAALLGELESRRWKARGIILADIGSSDTSPAYSELLDATGYVDARRGFGRMATLAPTLLGCELPAIRVLGGYLLHGAEIATIERKAETLRAAERDLIGLEDDPHAPKRQVVRTRLRIKDLSL